MLTHQYQEDTVTVRGQQGQRDTGVPRTSKICSDGRLTTVTQGH